MYPYKEEIMSSLRAFVLAWAMILVPLTAAAGVIHFLEPPTEQR